MPGASLSQRLSNPLGSNGCQTAQGHTGVKWSVVRQVSGGQGSKGCHPVLVRMGDKRLVVKQLRGLRSAGSCQTLGGHTAARWSVVKQVTSGQWPNVHFQGHALNWERWRRPGLDFEMTSVVTRGSSVTGARGCLTWFWSLHTSVACVPPGLATARIKQTNKSPFDSLPDSNFQNVLILL